MLDEEPGLQGVSAIDSRCARGEGDSPRVVECYKKSSWWLYTAIRSPCSNGPDEARPDDVAIGLAGSYDDTRTTAFSVLGVETEVCVSGSGGAADARGGVWKTAREQSTHTAR